VSRGKTAATRSENSGARSSAETTPLRASDLRDLGDRAPKGEILAVRVEHLLAKEARLAAQPDICFTMPHFDGYPAVLVRLGKIRVSDLKDLIVEAWLARAPKTLVRRYQGAEPPPKRKRRPRA
jgi:hypothetical protein